MWLTLGLPARVFTARIGKRTLNAGIVVNTCPTNPPSKLASVRSVGRGALAVSTITEIEPNPPFATTARRSGASFVDCAAAGPAHAHINSSRMITDERCQANRARWLVVF